MVTLDRAYAPLVGTSSKINSTFYVGVYNAGSEAEAIDTNGLVKTAMTSLGVQVVDLYEQYAEPAYLSDGLHPEDNGNDHWGQNVARAITARPLIVFRRPRPTRLVKPSPVPTPQPCLARGLGRLHMGLRVPAGQSVFGSQHHPGIPPSPYLAGLRRH
ncbi:hypothetical protein ARTHROSP310_03200 [Arthrobacter sp. AD-310]